MRNLISLLLLLSSCCTIHAQEIKVAEVSVISGIFSPQVAGPYILADKTSKPSMSPGRLIEVMSDAANIEVEAVYGNTIMDAGRINDNTFIIPSTQKMTLRVRCVDFDKKIYSKKVIELAGPDPGPGPGPGPDPDPDPEPGDDCSKVPDDTWGIGKKVCGWSKGLPNRIEVALLYDKYATRLTSEPKSISELIKEMTAERDSLLGAKKDQYTKVNEQLQTDLASKWPMDKATFSAYFKAVACGFRGSK